MPINPVFEWMAARLARSAPTPRELLDEMISLGMTPRDYSEARKALRVEFEEKTTAAGRKYRVLVLPKSEGAAFKPGYDPRRPGQRPGDLEKQEEELKEQLAEVRAAAKQKLTPDEVVKKAKEKLQNSSVRMARYLREMAEEAMKDPTKCPSCGRGMPRSEAIRLQAILGVLDRAGVQPPKGPALDGATGPVLIFPPGSQMAVAVKSEPSLGDSEGQAARVPEIQVRRADSL